MNMYLGKLTREVRVYDIQTEQFIMCLPKNKLVFFLKKTGKYWLEILCSSYMGKISLKQHEKINDLLNEV